MNTSNPIPAGVIEGFFGRSWQWPQRRQLASFLSEHQLDFYLYAPKSDPFLRRHWRASHPAEQWRELAATRETYRDCQIDFGVGLSPLDLCTDQGITDTAALDAKIKHLNTLELDYLALLFDDMRGDIPQLAQRQSELAERAANLSNAKRVILCPTYYSNDPVLEKVFGPAPEHYLETLGQTLDRAIDVFWTGPSVCSDHYPTEHLLEVNERLGRKPFLWDNYPVNDGAVRSQHLYLSPTKSDRSTAKPYIAGIAANPMNQFYASWPALAGLSQVLTSQQAPQCQTILQNLYSEQTAHYLKQDLPTFEQGGLNALSDHDKQILIERYTPLGIIDPIAAEICDWLAGGYTFDPSCLTE
ncbi:beta-N-acetylglucosaminidase domain-containing protein [Gilvimarinus sp. 1_MG-2023]|uniref:beta-N-acetylglucosaminidase domain-containing protein n=1 Tax=Gilvimarinus sp. 1_MG-2023 TaxID=3062638 RepID=UPI0026E275EA|nr:beta-N-acetylglucosaminidase domain-containing protein [Gilvimarinus sp. 1_MG-2023]MDO6745673.1 beta-N-acetylglucosaminidase domain-containing protein [Gilvimarinus sp. 1_MG-2023]